MKASITVTPLVRARAREVAQYHDVDIYTAMAMLAQVGAEMVGPSPGGGLTGYARQAVREAER